MEHPLFVALCIFVASLPPSIVSFSSLTTAAALGRRAHVAPRVGHFARARGTSHLVTRGKPRREKKSPKIEKGKSSPSQSIYIRFCRGFGEPSIFETLFRTAPCIYAHMLLPEVAWIFLVVLLQQRPPRLTNMEASETEFHFWAARWTTSVLYYLLWILDIFRAFNFATLFCPLGAPCVAATERGTDSDSGENFTTIDTLPFFPLFSFFPRAGPFIEILDLRLRMIQEKCIFNSKSDSLNPFSK